MLQDKPKSVNKAPYGYCPRCGAPGEERERRPGGNDHCINGHVYPSRDANTSSGINSRPTPAPKPRYDTLMVQLPYPCRVPPLLPRGVAMHLSSEQQANLDALGIPQEVQAQNADLVEVDCAAYPAWNLMVDAEKGLTINLGAVWCCWDSAGQYMGTVHLPGATVHSAE